MWWWCCLAKNVELDNPELTVKPTKQVHTEDIKYDNTVRPLDNPLVWTYGHYHVLSTIFSLSSSKDLAAYRLVSKYWYNISLSYWRAYVTVTLWGNALFSNSDVFWGDPANSVERSWRRHNNRKVDKEQLSPSQFLEVIANHENSCATKPFQRFHFREWDFSCGGREDAETFWTKCSSSIISLNLSECVFQDLDQVMDTIFNLQFVNSIVLNDIKYCNFTARDDYLYREPSRRQFNLKTLVIHVESVFIPKFVFQLLSHFPALNSLAICKINRCVKGNPEIWNGTKSLGPYDRVNSLKKLRLECELTSEQVESLSEWFPNLEGLALPLNNDSFRTVCTYWRNLKDLVILSDLVDNDGLTGYVGGRSDGMRLPNITDLTVLRSFVIPVEYASRRRSHFFIERSIQCLLQLNLTHLEVSVEVGSETVRKLKESISFCVLRLQMNQDEKLNVMLASRGKRSDPTRPFWNTVTNFKGSGYEHEKLKTWQLCNSNK